MSFFALTKGVVREMADRVQEYVSNVVQELKGMSALEQEAKLKKVEAKVKAKVLDADNVRKIMTLIRSQLDTQSIRLPSTVSGFTMATVAAPAPRKRPSSPIVKSTPKPKAVAVAPPAKKVKMHIDSFIEKDEHEPQEEEEGEDDDEDDDNEEGESGGEEEPIDPVYDPENYKGADGTIDFAKMHRAVHLHVQASQVKAAKELNSRLQRHVEESGEQPIDQDALFTDPNVKRRRAELAQGIIAKRETEKRALQIRIDELQARVDAETSVMNGKTHDKKTKTKMKQQINKLKQELEALDGRMTMFDEVIREQQRIIAQAAT